MNKHDGGPAYPAPANPTTDIHGFDVTSGMSLRDWFAGQALVGTLASVEALGPFEGAADIAQQAYRMADKMLEAREAKP